MSAVVNVKIVSVGGEDSPEYIDVTLANGQTVRYRREGR